MLCSICYTKLIFFYYSEDQELHSVDRAHESVIYNMSWHPLGHVLTTCSNDFSTRFWIRNRPGDKLKDKANWPLANSMPPPLYGRGAALAGASGFEEEDEEGAISTPFGTIDVTAMNVKTATIPAAASAMGLPPSVNLPAGFQVAYPPGMGGLPVMMQAPQSEDTKKKVLSNVKLTTPAQATETVPGLGDVVNYNEEEQGAQVPGADSKDGIKKGTKRGIQKQFEDVWEGGRSRPGPAAAPARWAQGEGGEKNLEAYDAFRQSWEGTNDSYPETGHPESYGDQSHHHEYDDRYNPDYRRDYRPRDREYGEYPTDNYGPPPGDYDRDSYNPSEYPNRYVCLINFHLVPFFNYFFCLLSK